MKNTPLTSADFAQIAARALDAPQGCGDNSCVVRTPTGMATNGGCRCERPALRQAAGQAQALRADVHRLLAELGQGHLLDPALSYRVARPRRDLVPRLSSRWTPPSVWTLHLVPVPIGGVLAVRRRVLSDDDIALVIETPGGTMHVDLDGLAQSGHARGWGSHRHDRKGIRPVAGLWGCDLSLDVYDHVPNAVERHAWLSRRIREQELVALPPESVWVTLPGAAGKPDRVARCRCSRLLGARGGDIGRADLEVELPGYVPPIPERPIYEHRITVDLYALATTITVDGLPVATSPSAGTDGAGRVFLQKPSAAVLAREGRRRARGE